MLVFARTQNPACLTPLSTPSGCRLHLRLKFAGKVDTLVEMVVLAKLEYDVGLG